MTLLYKWLKKQVLRDATAPPHYKFSWVQARQAILGVQTASMPLGADFGVSAIAAQTNGFSGSDLAALCREAGIAAMSRNLATSNSSNTSQVLIPLLRSQSVQKQGYIHD